MEEILEETRADLENGVAGGKRNVKFDEEDAKAHHQRSRSNSPRSRSGSNTSNRDALKEVRCSPKGSPRRIPLRSSPRTSPLLNNSRRVITTDNGSEMYSDSVTSLLEQRFNSTKARNNKRASPLFQRKPSFKQQEVIAMQSRRDSNNIHSAPASPKLRGDQGNNHSNSMRYHRPRTASESESLKLCDGRTSRVGDQRLSYSAISIHNDEHMYHAMDLKQIQAHVRGKRKSDTSNASSVDIEALEELQRRATRAKSIAPHMTPALSRPYKQPGAEILVALMIISAGAVSFIVAKATNGDKAWMIMGVVCMILGCLFFTLGVCWLCVANSRSAEKDLQEKLIQATEIIVHEGHHHQGKVTCTVQHHPTTPNGANKHKKKRHKSATDAETVDDRVSITESEVLEPMEFR